ncbi:hypothetical protein D3C72_1297290 [compost metagenome]
MVGGAPEVQHAFEGRIGVAERDPHREAVELRLGQRMRADLLERVLRGDDEERRGQRMRGAVVRHLPLGHGLQQRALGFRRGAVDLVGEHQLGEDRAAMEAELAGLAQEDRYANQIRRQQIARELHPLVLQAQRLRQRMRERGLAHAGYVFEQQVAAGQHAGQGKAHLARLAQ